MRLFVDCAGTNELYPVGTLDVEVGGREIVLVYNGSEVYALGAVCTHAGAWLSMGDVLIETNEIQCPLHGGGFYLKTGAASRFPCVEAVSTYSVEVRDGRILVDPESAG